MRRVVVVLLVAMVLGAGCASAPAATLVEVRVSPGHLHGWYFTNVHTGEDGVVVGATGGTGEFVTGPSGSHGDGSYHLTTPGMADKARLFNDDRAGTPLADLEAIAYRTRKTGVAGYAPSANMVIDPEGPDDYASLAWEPNKAGFVVQEDTWQRWSTDDGPGWWSSSIPAGSTTPGANSHPTDLDGILDHFGRGTTIVSLGINLGRSNPGMDAYVDDLAVTIAGVTTTFDFEPADPAPASPEPPVTVAPPPVPTTTTTTTIPPTTTTTTPVGAPGTGPTVTLPPTAPPPVVHDVVGVVTTPSGSGSWQLTPDGDVVVTGDAPDLGDVADVDLRAPVAALAPTPTGDGYWVVAADGGVFAFGDAPFLGSSATIELAAPAVALAPTPTGRGYVVVAADGGVFAYGDARYEGGMAGRPLNRPVVGATVPPTGTGYWLVGADGGVFCFGGAKFYGSLGASPPPVKVVAIVPTATGHGYWLRDANGKLYPFGDAVGVR